MIWIILGLVFLVVTYLSLKGTIIEVYNGKNKIDEYYIPVWVLLVLGLFYIIPVFSIIVFIVYLIIFLMGAIRKPDYWDDRIIFRLSSKNILHRILRIVIHFLTKHI